MKKLLIFLVILTAGLVQGTAQSKSLTEAEFFSLSRKASDATYAVPYRSMKTNREFVNGVPRIQWTQTKEALRLGTSRLIQKREEGVIEVISVNKTNYQREDGGKWRVVRTPENVVLGGTLFGDFTSEYFSEEVSLLGRKYILLTWLVKFHGVDSFSKRSQEGRFNEMKKYVAPDGKVFREETSGGTLDPKIVVWDEVVNYSYDVGPLKIEAPIK